MLELIAGVVVAFVAVAAVLQPLLAGGRSSMQMGVARAGAVEFEDLEESGSPKVRALLALKEIEFDRATGKLSEEDYEELKVKYSRVALSEIKKEEQGTVGKQDAAAEGDAAEALVRQVATGGTVVCPSCGPRPEADAAFCSDCGKPLSTSSAETFSTEGGAYCEACGAKLSGSAKFCPECGTKVGAQAAGSAS
ncbi:MAG: zinc ribbon domain-containing protein [Gemmatimonadales bacterium]|jgi:DNA-directed RNA polymerase subunit RPC12/RpoP